MRPLLMWSFATLVVLLPVPALACGNSMHREFEHAPVVKKTPQQVAWSTIRGGDFEGARRQLAADFPHLNPLTVQKSHIPGMRAAQLDALHAIAVTHVRTLQHQHWGTQVLEALVERDTPRTKGHLAEAYALSDDEATRARGWAMLETLDRDRELSDPYTLTLLAVIRIQAGDTTGGRRAFGLAQTLRTSGLGLGEVVCCTVGEAALGGSGYGIGGLGLRGVGGDAPRL